MFENMKKLPQNPEYAKMRHVSKKYPAWSCQNVCEAPTFLLDNVFIQLGTKFFRQVVGTPMGTNCALPNADLFFFVMRGIS